MGNNNTTITTTPSTTNFKPTLLTKPKTTVAHSSTEPSKSLFTYTDKPKQSTSSNGDIAQIIAWCLGGVVIIMMFIILLNIYRRKKKQEQGLNASDMKQVFVQSLLNI
jgi:beta-lactamase regulating signal transducer with metallopeptidase domain